MNKFKKKTRSKMIAASIAILSSAAVVSTGFAAWVISGGDKNSNVSGTITADAVTDEIHKITITDETNKEVYFGAPKGEQSNDAWLKNDGGEEKLKPSITFTVAGLQNKIMKPSELFTSITLTEKTDTLDANKYSKAFNLGVVADLPKFAVGSAFDTTVEDVSKIYLSSESFSDTDKTQTFKVTMVFGWGSKFGSENPYKHYAGQAYTKDLASSAKTLLEAVQAIKTSFTLTIVTK